MFLCLSETSQKNLVYGALIEAEILTSPLPHVLAQLGQVVGHQHSAHGCVSASNIVLKCLYVSQEPPKMLVYGALIEAEILTPPSSMYLLNFDKLLGTSTLPNGVPTPPKLF